MNFLQINIRDAGGTLKDRFRMKLFQLLPVPEPPEHADSVHAGSAPGLHVRTRIAEIQTFFRRRSQISQQREQRRRIRFQRDPRLLAPDAGVYRQDCTFVGVVRERLPGGRVRVELRNRFPAGANLEVLSPHTLGLTFTARNLTDSNGAAVASACVPMALYDLDAPEAEALLLAVLDTFALD